MVDPLRVPGYLVERLAGAGGSGQVWVAREQVSGRRVALKRLRGAGPAQRAALEREAALLAAVHHPHVLALRSVVDSGSDLVLVLDLAEGGSLRDLLDQRGRLFAGEVVTATAPIAQALAEVHRAGLVHGDVTPANILFTRDGRPLLADLGVARIAGAVPDLVSATAAYAAPEVLAGAPPTPAADVFGLACVVMAALTGAPSSDVDDEAADTLSGLPAASLDVLDQARSGQPERRPAASALADGLFALAPPTPVRLALASAADGAAAEAAASRPPDTGEVTHSEAFPGPATAGSRPAAPPVSPPASRSAPPSVSGPDAQPDPGAAGAFGVGSASDHTHQMAGPQLAAATEPRSGSRSRGRLALLGAGTLVVAAAVVVLVFWLIDRDGAAGAPAVSRPAAAAPATVPCAGPTASATPLAVPTDLESQDWVTVVEELYAARSAAFATADPARLCEVFAPGARGLEEDRGKVDYYRDHGYRTDGLDFQVVEAAADGRDGDAVVVEITDRLPPYRVVDGSGDVVSQQSGLKIRSWRAALVRLDDGWRFR
jgi:serine/threonine protein kinase